MANVLLGFQTFMDAGPPFLPLLILLVLTIIPVTVVHELGHALAARSRLGTEGEISVGHTGRLLDFHLGNLALSINLVADPRKPAGQATFDGSRATALDVMWIALAGPGASFVGWVVVVLLYNAAPSTGLWHDILWTAALGSAFAVLNLIPLRLEERRGGRPIFTDGRIAIDAAKAAQGRV